MSGWTKAGLGLAGLAALAGGGKMILNRWPVDHAGGASAGTSPQMGGNPPQGGETRTIQIEWTGKWGEWTDSIDVPKTITRDGLRQKLIQWMATVSNNETRASLLWNEAGNLEFQLNGAKLDNGLMDFSLDYPKPLEGEVNITIHFPAQ